MKLFISGQIHESNNLREIFHAVEQKGHTITHDWTATDIFLGGQKAKRDNPEEAGVRAQADLNGVIACDVYVLCSDNELPGKGMYVELGAALALHEISNERKPKIYIVGPFNHSSIFYYHPAITRKDTIEEVLEEL